jgi:hypothetical protein
MGVYHFMGLGTSPGVVTCAVDYIEKALDIFEGQRTGDKQAVLNLFRGTGGITHAEARKGKIEAIVLFTSKEVINRTKPEGALYMKTDEVRDDLLRQLKKVWTTPISEGRKVFWCEVDVDDFRDCLEKTVKVAYRFKRPTAPGKEIWCNLTGGTNAVNLALLSMAQLTASSTKLYMIAQRKDFGRPIEVPPQIKIAPNKDGYFNLLPFLKTYEDTLGLYEVLAELESLDAPIDNQELFYRLHSKSPRIKELSSQPKPVQAFVRKYMLPLHNMGYTFIEGEKDNETTKITEDGKHYLNEYLREVEELIDLQNSDNFVEESKTWDWFKERDVV